MAETWTVRRRCGAVALAVVGFSWGGWVTGGTARLMAADQSQTDVVSALTSICLDQSKRDPQLTERVSTSQSRLVMEAGATMPGTTEGNRPVAIACANELGICSRSTGRSHL